MRMRVAGRTHAYTHTVPRPFSPHRPDLQGGPTQLFLRATKLGMPPPLVYIKIDVPALVTGCSFALRPCCGRSLRPGRRGSWQGATRRATRTRARPRERAAERVPQRKRLGPPLCSGRHRVFICDLGVSQGAPLFLGSPLAVAQGGFVLRARSGGRVDTLESMQQRALSPARTPLSTPPPLPFSPRLPFGARWASTNGCGGSAWHATPSSWPSSASAATRAASRPSPPPSGPPSPKGPKRCSPCPIMDPLGLIQGQAAPAPAACSRTNPGLLQWSVTVEQFMVRSSVISARRSSPPLGGCSHLELGLLGTILKIED